MVSPIPKGLIIMIILCLASCTRSASSSIPIPATLATATEAIPKTALREGENQVVQPKNPSEQETPELPPALAAEGLSPAAVGAASFPQEPIQITAKNASNLAEMASIDVQNPGRLIWSQDGSTLGVMNKAGLELLDGKTLAVISRVELAQPMYLLDFSATTRSMATTADQQTVELRDILTGNVIQTIKPVSKVASASYSPDGSILSIVASGEISVGLWNVADGKLIQTLTGFQSSAPVYSATLSADGKSILWISRNIVQVMDRASGQSGHRFDHEDSVGAAAISLDGRWLATTAAGTMDGNLSPLIYLWDLNSGEKKFTAPAGENVPANLSFSTDGSLLASYDGWTINLWDLAAGQTLGAFSGHRDTIFAVAFSPDGKTLASSAADNMVRLWRIKSK